MNFKEFAVDTPHETHTLIAGYFAAKIRKGKYVYYIDCADICPIEIARIKMPNEPLTAQTLGEAKHKVAQIFNDFAQANAQKQAELSKLWKAIQKKTE